MTNREEVAERLRVYATGFDFGESNPLWYVEKAVFNDIKIRNSGRVFSRLADFIDPVCRLVEVNDDDGTKYICSNCGCFYVKDLQLLDGFKYCPVCGVRTVRDEREDNE